MTQPTRVDVAAAQAAMRKELAAQEAAIQEELAWCRCRAPVADRCYLGAVTCRRCGRWMRPNELWNNGEVR